VKKSGKIRGVLQATAAHPYLDPGHKLRCR
jgi:hypothetical protein